jgi:ATP-dependent Clp protease ATP-binding subunit ClpA/post-segregation antitoxin (ccd killing protein)
MPKINVYLPDALADAVRDAQVPVSAVCQAALERAVRDVTAARATDEPPDDRADKAWTGLFARFTPRARQVLTLGQEAARAVPHNYVGTEHLLLGVLDEGGNVALRVLAALEVDEDDLRAELAGSMLPPTTRMQGHIPFTPRAKRVLELAAKEAMHLGHNCVGCEHVLLGLIAVEDAVASKVLRRLGLELRTTRLAVTRALLEVVTSAPPPSPTAAAPPSSGDAFSQILERLDAIERRLEG